MELHIFVGFIPIMVLIFCTHLDVGTDFKFFFKTELKNTNLGCDINLDDPDITFLLSGGFAYYDDKGTVIGALALANRDTEYFMHFGEPCPLSGDDANRFANCAYLW